MKMERTPRKTKRTDKMASFFNQASLSFNGQITNSNITEGELLGRLSVEKTALANSYSQGDTVAYMLTVTNTGGNALSGVSLTDNLGSYRVGDTSYTPLSYVDGSIMAYINGVAVAAPQITAGTDLVIQAPDIPVDGTLTVIYQTTVTAQAQLGEGAVITNTVTATVGAETATDEATITAEGGVNLSIAKAICPPVITEGAEVTYTLIIQNSGATSVTAEDAVILNDVFNPPLSGITVVANGASWTEGNEYTYDEASGAFATTAGAITLPGATYERDPVSGVVTTNPAVLAISISGTI